MILPNKYIKPAESIIYKSTIIIKNLDNKRMNITDLWLKIKKNNLRMSYSNYIHIIIYLYSIGIISYTDRGEIYNENFKGWDIFS